jgi:ABC-type uncharacterized transport system YnjBCD ATPase subunit
VSLAVEPGEIVGVIGPNASGKTTLIRLFSGLLRPTRGEVLLEGQPLARMTRAAVATRVGVVPQDVPRDFPYTVEELVLMGRFPHAPGRFFESVEDRRVAWEAMGQVGVRGLAGERCDRLSGGERQRVMLARALAQEPRLLVLDEPTTGGSTRSRGCRWCSSRTISISPAISATACSSCRKAERRGRAIPNLSSRRPRSRPPMAVRWRWTGIPSAGAGASTSSGPSRRRRRGGEAPHESTHPETSRSKGSRSRLAWRAESGTVPPL